MAGLIDARILQPELAGSFAAGYRGAEQARQQTQQNQQQFEMNQMKLAQLKQDRAALTDLQSKLRAAGQSDDPNMFFRALIQTGNPDYMSKGYEGLQRYKDLVAYEREFGGGAPANAMAAPAASMAAPAAAAPAANVPAPAVEGMFSPPSAATVEAERQQGRLARINQMAAAGVTLDAAAPGLPAPAANALTPTNALAPAAAAPVTNAMAAATPDINALMRRYNLASRAGSPDAAVILKQVEAALKADKMSLSDRFVPVGNLVFDRQTEKFISPTEAQLAMTRAQQQQDPLIRQYEYAKNQGFKGSLFDYKRSIAEAGRPPAQPRAEPAPRTKEVTLNDGTLGIMNMDTGAITRATVSGVPAKGKPSAFAEKTAAQRVQLEKDLTTAIAELKEVVKPGNLIDQSTGSGAGRAVDVANRFVGRATAGDIAIGKLAPIADLVLKMVPRFEGPQSDKDTKSYKEAAGQLSDATLPREIRKEAANTIIRLMENRKGQFVTKEMAAEGASASSTPAPPPGFTPDNR